MQSHLQERRNGTLYPISYTQPPCSGPVLKGSVVTAISVIRISALCNTPHDAEEETVLRICANTPMPGLTFFVLEILSLCWSGAEEKQHGGCWVQLNMGRHSLDCDRRWVYLKWVCWWQDNLQPRSQGLMAGIQSHVPFCSTPFVAGWASRDKAHIEGRLARSRYNPLSYC